MCTTYMIFLWIFETLQHDRFSNGMGTLDTESVLIQKSGSCNKLITLPANHIQFIILLSLEIARKENDRISPNTRMNHYYLAFIVC